MSIRHSLILALDPGLTGAGAFLQYAPGEEQPVLLRGVFDMPARVDAKGKRVLDVVALARTIRDHPLYAPTLAVIEEVGAAPGQGVSSMFTFGFNAGALAGVCAALGMDLTYRRPQHWQRFARLVFAAHPGKDKKHVAREHAASVFPQQAHLFRRAKDHGRADAALLGYAYFSEQFQTLKR